jgi:hypothetical protein
LNFKFGQVQVRFEICRWAKLGQLWNILQCLMVEDCCQLTSWEGCMRMDMLLLMTLLV